MEIKNSVNTSEFRLIVLFVLLVVLNGIKIHIAGFDFNLNIPQDQMKEIYGAVVGWAVIRQVAKK